MGDRYEWDAGKAAENLRKHDVSFEDAAEALTDPDGVVSYDRAHSQEEDRFRWLGLSSEGVLLVVFADSLDEGGYRIISARRATRRERDSYYE